MARQTKDSSHHCAVIAFNYKLLKSSFHGKNHYLSTCQNFSLFAISHIGPLSRHPSHYFPLCFSDYCSNPRTLLLHEHSCIKIQLIHILRWRLPMVSAWCCIRNNQLLLRRSVPFHVICRLSVQQARMLHLSAMHHQVPLIPHNPSLHHKELHPSCIKSIQKYLKKLHKIMKVSGTFLHHDGTTRPHILGY